MEGCPNASGISLASACRARPSPTPPTSGSIVSRRISPPPSVVRSRLRRYYPCAGHGIRYFEAGTRRTTPPFVEFAHVRDRPRVFVLKNYSRTRRNRHPKTITASFINGLRCWRSSSFCISATSCRISFEPKAM